MRLPFRPIERIRERIQDRRDQRNGRTQEELSQLRTQQETMKKEELPAEKIGRGQYLLSAAHPLHMHYERANGERIDTWVTINPEERAKEISNVLKADLRSGKNSQRVEDRLFYLKVQEDFVGTVTLWQHGRQTTLKLPEGAITVPDVSLEHAGEIQEMRKVIAETRARLENILPLLQAVRESLAGAAEQGAPVEAKAKELEAEAAALKQRLEQQEKRAEDLTKGE